MCKGLTSPKIQGVRYMCIFYLGNGSYSFVGLGPPGVFHSLSFRIPGARILGDGIIPISSVDYRISVRVSHVCSFE